MFYHAKDAQNVITQVKLFIICSKCHNSSETLHNGMKSLLEDQNSNNSEFGCYLI